jgi:hypothetical protein
MGNRIYPKRLVLYIGLALVLIVIVLYVQDHNLESFEDPMWVANSFSYGLIIGDKQFMKNRSAKRIHNKIDISFPNEIPPDWLDEFVKGKDLELVCLRRLKYSIVCTFKLDSIDLMPGIFSREGDPRFFFYTILVEPVGPSSWWESIKDIVYFKVPLGDKLVSWRTPERWLVTDFYSKNDFPDYFVTCMERFKSMGKGIKSSFGETIYRDGNESKWVETFAESLVSSLERDMNYINGWKQRELGKQNAEIKALYADFSGISDTNTTPAP